MGTPYVAQNSTIKLYEGVRIHKATGENIAFKSVAQQTAYFNKKLKKTWSACSYARRRGGVGRVSLQIDPAELGTLDSCNYMSFQNPGFENILYYCHVIDLTYVNNHTVAIDFMIDSHQTYLTKYTCDNVIIEQEQLSEDDWQTATENPQADILELETFEDFQVRDEDFMIGTISDGPVLSVPGNKITLPTPGQQDTVLMKSVVLIKFSWDLNPAADMSDVEINGQKVLIEDTATIRKLVILDQFDGYFTAGWQFEPVEYTTTASKAINAWYGTHTDLASGITGAFFKNAMAFLDTIFKLQEATTGVPGITTQDIFKSGTYTAPQKTYASVNQTPMPGVFAWFELDENGNLPDTWQDVLDVLARNDLISSIVYAAKVPKFLTMFAKNDGKKSWTNVSYPQATAGPFTLQILKPTGDLHPKAYRYPYQSIRAILPDGTSKDYRFEWFTNDGVSVRFDMFGDIGSIPTIYYMPIDYNVRQKPGDKTPDFIARINPHEVIKYDKFPQVAMATDAYNIQIGAKLNRVAGMTTAEAVNNLVGSLSAIAPVYVAGQDATKTKPAIDPYYTTPGPSGALSAYGAITEHFNNSAALTLRNWGADPAAHNGNFRKMRESNLTSYTVTGSDDIGLTVALENEYATFEIRSVKREILKQLSDMCNRYGCTSGRFGVPRILRWMRNQAINIPHFTKYGGFGETEKLGTFCRTNGITIKGVPNYAAADIADMYNAGCWFWKGDELE